MATSRMLARLSLAPRPLPRFFSSSSAHAAPKPSSTTSTDKPRRQLTAIQKSGQSQFKTYLPVTPSLRQLRLPVSPFLHKGSPLRALTIEKRSTGGRNDHGRITTRARGGGHRRRIRNVDFMRMTEGRQDVVRIEYDPGRSGHIALLKHAETGELSYILAPEGLREGDEVQSFRNMAVPKSTPKWDRQTVLEPKEELSLPTVADSLALPGLPSTSGSTPAPPPIVTDTPPEMDIALLRTHALRAGNCLPLSLLPLGTTIHAISLSPSTPLLLSRSAGSSARIVAHTPTGETMIRLGSGEVRLIGKGGAGTVGKVGNADWGKADWGKAGRARWRGFRPQTRGVAMNATDHPHGGGRGKSKGNKKPVDKWNNSAKGTRTRAPNSKNGNKMVVKERRESRTK